MYNCYFCIAELQSGVTCTKSNLPTECIRIPNALCKSSGDTGLKCTCNMGYYDSNFADTGGSCILGEYSICYSTF